MNADMLTPSANLAAPDRLRINLLPHPLSVTRGKMAFSWCMNATESSTAEIQTGYRIYIVSRPEAMEDEDYLLDTGWIASDECSDVYIAGLDAILEDNELYYWALRTRNKDGMESQLSALQPFTTAIGTAWESTDGIWCPPTLGDDGAPLPQSADFAFLRTEFELPAFERMECAVLSVTATSPEPSRQYVYNAFVNGTFVGLGPARLDRGEDGEELLYYHSYDVTALLHEGENALGALCYTTREKAFLCQLTVYYKNGTHRVLVNSGRDAESWLAMDGYAALRPSNSIGTNYFHAAACNVDATRYPHNFATVGFRSDEFHPASLSDAALISDNRMLAPYPGEPVGRYATPAATVIDHGNGCYFIDLGREIIGSLRLCISVPEACEIELRYGEELDENGTVRYRMRTSNVYKEHWVLSPDAEQIEGYSMMGFRYVEIEGCPVPLKEDNVYGVAIRREFDEDASSFVCVNDTLCDLYDTFKYAICATNQDLYVDSQTRERCAYEGDVLINMLSAYTYETPGALPRFSARYLLTHRTWPAEYELTTIHNILLDYLYTGNRAVIKETYPQLKAILAHDAPDEQTGLIARRTAAPMGTDAILVDWPSGSRDGYCMSDAHFNTVYNAFYYLVLCDMATIAHALGKTDDATDYRADADALQHSMITHLYNEEKGAFCDGLTEDGTTIDHYSQHATVFPLFAGIYDSAAMADACGRYLIGQGDIRTSIYGAFFLMEALYRVGFGTYATALLADDGSAGNHSWAAALAAKDVTLAPEAWFVEEKGNMTFSHPWGSAPASLIVRCMFGIRPTTPGFRTFEVRPQIGDLPYAAITIPTVKGTIGVSLGQNSEAYEMEVTIPANTQADIYLPVLPGGTDTLFIGDRLANYPIENGVYHITLGSGKYRLLAQ